MDDRSKNLRGDGAMSRLNEDDELNEGHSSNRIKSIGGKLSMNCSTFSGNIKKMDISLDLKRGGRMGIKAASEMGRSTVAQFSMDQKTRVPSE
ncbi:hypothetical protein E2542_SST27538 [Spatholobus suberectus]|nr:hypothetical protein E2542_SST27538 [Spatholobus suberectus]